MNVYLDYNATTPVDPRVAEVAIPYLKKDSFGNPSSFHFYGRTARSVVAEAREKVARMLKAEADSLVFTGSGSEGDNHAIKGTFYARREKGNHIITTSVEHPAVLGTCEWLRIYEGAEVTVLNVDSGGNLDLAELEAAIRPTTTLVTVMLANNETGVIFPIREIAAICHAHDIWLHTDAVQAIAKLPIDVKELGADLLSIAGHKIYAPKGIGCTYIRPGLEINNLLHGGHQEHGLRAGTENVLGIVALGEACELIRENFEADAAHMAVLRDRLEQGLLERVPYTTVNGDPANRVCNTSNMVFPYVEGEALLLALDMAGIAVSSGSACATGSTEPSHVLRAMGLPPELARASLRFSLGRFTMEEEIDYVLEKLPPIAQRLRSLSPVYPGDPA